MINSSIDRAAVLSWFTGKNRANAENALNLLAQSAERGCWIPKASRTVDAALKKANIAMKAARAADGRDGGQDLRMCKSSENPAYSLTSGFTVYMGLTYGGSYLVQTMDLDLDALLSNATDEPVKYAIQLVGKFRRDMAPVLTLIAELEATKPMPVITNIGASPTITRTLEDIGVVGNVATIRLCPIKWIRIDIVNKVTGAKTYEMHAFLVWPEGTVHGKSRFSQHNDQCEACSHGIKNPFNWMPLLIDNDVGVPHSLWVGRDCAQTLFGIKMSGELHIEGRNQT